MKIRRAILAAVVAIGVSSSPSYALSLTDPGVLGTIVDAIPFGDDSIAAFMNIFLWLPTSTAPTKIGTETYTRNDVDTPGSDSVTAVGASGSSLATAAGFEYILAKYDGMNGGAVVYYAGGQSLTLPALSTGLWENTAGNGYSLSGWKAFNSVPDGGSTVALLGFAVLGLAALRRRLN